MLDESRIRKTGWRPAISLRDGLARTYAWFQAMAAEGVDGLRRKTNDKR